MPKLTRYLQKIFANNSNQVGVFGTGVDKETSKNVETLQSADYEEGWSSAIITNKNYPIWQEMDGVQYGLSYQLKYLFQNGISEWLSTETYYTNSYCRVGSNIYYSLQDDNINHNPALNDGWWTPLLTSNRSIGEIIPSTIPLTEAGLHLLDGALITNGMYADFITYMANLTATAPDCFCTEAEWQQSVATYGVCGKFVYDSVNNTVRLPKWGSQAFTKTSSVSTDATVPVVGNGKTIGLVDSTNTGYGLTAANSYLIGNKAPYGQNFGTASISGQNYTGTTSLGLTSSGGDSGIVADVSSLTSLINEYPLDCYYYIVIATNVKTDIVVDIDEIATDLNGKADVDGTNMVNSVKKFDGQWVYTNTQIVTNVTAPTTNSLSYSLSSYLPNDAYNYEVLFVANGTTGSTSGDRVYLELETDIQPNVCYVGLARTRTASDVSCAGSCIMAVGSGREVIIVATGNNTGYISLRALGYRRIGTNQ